LVILTRYTTITVRHGPKVQWDWAIQCHRNKKTGTTKEDALASLKGLGFQEGDIVTDRPHYLGGLFMREFLDEGHEIRHQSKEIWLTVTSLEATYRHIISGMPTFNSLEGFTGLMKFLQNPILQDVVHLKSLGFGDKELFGSRSRVRTPLLRVQFCGSLIHILSARMIRVPP
jgi:hypothetical protein